jgi:hypothetical protein
MSNPKKRGKNKQRVFLDVFSPSENDSGVHLPVKNLFHMLENLWTFAVQHCTIQAVTLLVGLVVEHAMQI